MEKRTIKSAKLYTEDGKYYLGIVYNIETDHTIEELWIPKVRLPIENARIESELVSSFNNRCFTLDYGDLLHLPLEDRESDQGSFTFKETLVKELPEDLTIEEIEKRLGYKVRIVNK